MRGTEFAEIDTFCTVAAEESFVKAAKKLGVSPSAVSQSIRSLEERLNTQLFVRTTRSVRLTEDGDRLLAQVRPALEGIRLAMDSAQRARSIGYPPLRLSVSSIPAKMILAPIIAGFLARYPGIAFEITVEDNIHDIQSGKFDAGIRHGWRISPDLEVVEVSRKSKMVVVGSRKYLETRPVPQTPQDLYQHNCIRLRMADGSFFKWRFMKDGGAFEVGVSGNLIVNSAELLVRACLDGVGLITVSEEYLNSIPNRDALTVLLKNWSTSPTAYYLYYPKGAVSASLAVFIDFMREAGAGSGASR